MKETLSRRGVLAATMYAPAAHAQSKEAALNPRLFSFIGGKAGGWRVVETKPVTGAILPAVPRLDLVAGSVSRPLDVATWTLHGVTSNTRYVTEAEKKLLSSKQASLGRTDATRAAMIPIRKSAAWWDLTQEERRKIFEDSSHHTQTGLKYLPDIARRLHHCRDLENDEPFDFITWFDYAPQHSQAFEDLVGKLRETEEWKFVEREVDIRLVRDQGK